MGIRNSSFSLGVDDSLREEIIRGKTLVNESSKGGVATPYGFKLERYWDRGSGGIQGENDGAMVRFGSRVVVNGGVGEVFYPRIVGNTSIQSF